MSAGQFINQEHVAALIADYAGLSSEHIPASRIEAADASGGLAFRQGVLSVASGAADIVVASGVEKMTDLGSSETTDALAGSADREWEVFGGGNIAGLYAMMARAHMDEYGTTRSELSSVAVKNHGYGQENQFAQFQNAVSSDLVEATPYVAEPLRMFDCSSASDGAAAVVLADAEKAREYTDSPIYVDGIGQASDSLAIHDRRSITAMDSTISAADTAYEMADVTPNEIDIAEIHDSYTIGEIMGVEDLGLAEKGEGGSYVSSIDEGDEIYVNPSGGLKACGHPLGATGVRQVVDVTRRLRGEDLPGSEGTTTGLTHNVGGTGGTAIVSILARRD